MTAVGTEVVGRQRVDRDDGLVVALFAALSWIPLFLTNWGRLNADTKLYLYLDPAGLLESAPQLWNPQWSGGTVTHQNIGYLWPMGPYYLLTEWVGLPDWIAQRFWFGSILFAAAMGAYVCFRSLWRDRLAATAGAFVFGFSPFVLGHITGQSALLLPFVALPWLVWAVRNALRGDPWRWTAAAALITTSAGALNGSSIFFVLAGVVLWIPFAVWWERSSSLRNGLLVLARLALLVTATQLWWLVAYRVGGQYGQPILNVTETVNQTSATTSSVEVLRGLGYWFFYGGDHLGPWLEGLAPAFTQNVLLLAVSFVAPLLCLVLGWLSRARERAYFMAMVVVGILLSTIAFGGTDRSPAGTVFESLSLRSELVLSLRNTQRAAALVAFGLAGLGACGVAALRGRSVPLGRLATGALAVVVVLTFLVPWRSGLLPDRYQRPEDVPRAWVEAAHYLDEVGGRSLLVPGIDFGAHRWGHTLDPVLPALTRTEVIWREQLPMGGAAGADLVAAFDEALQTGQLDPAAIVPVARALGVDHIVVAGDLEYERYRTVRPELVMATMLDPTSGLRLVRTFGDGYINRPPGEQIVDDRSLDDPAPTPIPQVAIFDVPGAGTDPVDATVSGAETVLHGDGKGIVAAAASGLLDEGHLPLLLASELRDWPTARELIRTSGVRHVVTDTSRREVRRYFTLTGNDGATLDLEDRPRSGLESDTASSSLLPSDERSQSIAVITGARAVDATGYGDIVRLLPEDRPVHAFDGDPSTAWRIDTGYFRNLRGDAPNELFIDIGRPVGTDHVTVIQSDALPGTQPVTQFELVLDGSRTIPVTVDPATAFDPGGIQVPLDGRPFSTLLLRVPDDPALTGPIAIAEVGIPGVRVEETIRMPLTLADLASPTGPLRVAWVMTRQRVDPGDTTRFDPERTIRRTFLVPRSTALNLSGVVRLDGRASEALLDAIEGTTSTITATSSAHRLGDPSSRASSALDGNPSTAWITPIGGAVGASWTARVPSGFRLVEVPIDLVADGRHSIPTRITLTAGGVSQTVDVPTTETGPNGIRRVVLRPDQPLVGTELTMQIIDVDAPPTVDAAGVERIAPTAVADVYLSTGTTTPTATIGTTSTCRNDLLLIDGKPVSIRLGPPADDTLRTRTFTTCDGARIVLDTGEHSIRTAIGADTGLSIDRISLVAPVFTNAPTTTDLGPAPRVEDAGRERATIVGTGTPYWVRLDQSANEGWSATARWDDGSIDLGSAHTVDGFAAGWLMDQNTSGSSRFSFSWRPQRSVNLALGISAAAVLLCSGLCVLGWRRRSTTIGTTTPALAMDPFSGRAPWIPESVIAVLVAIAVGGFVVGGAVAVLAVVATFSARSRLASIAARSAPLVALVTAVALVVWRQARHLYIHDVVWPSYFLESHSLVLFGVIGLALLVSADRIEDLRSGVGPPAAGRSERRQGAGRDTGKDPERDDPDDDTIDDLASDLMAR